jgi:metal-dependent amidase/aminoacylase/carboxypeptidase family protein
LINFVELNQLIKEAEKWAISLRHDFHRWPELGNNEFRTSERIRRELDQLNIKNTNSVEYPDIEYLYKFCKKNVG